VQMSKEVDRNKIWCVMIQEREREELNNVCVCGRGVKLGELNKEIHF
jgi:hypothetical protein